MVTVTCKCGFAKPFATDRRVRHFCLIAGELVTHYPANWKGPKERPPFCENLGEATGEQAVVVCLNCNKERVERRHPIYHCELFGECLPTYRCTKDALSESMDREIAVCYGCESFASPPRASG